MRLAICVVAIVLCLCAYAEAAPQPTPAVNVETVTVEGGQIRGVFEEDGKIAVFKGVPFAAPPVGELRWRAPQPVKAWEGIRNADAYSPACTQDNTEPEGNGFFDQMIEGQGMGWFRKTLFKLVVGLASESEQSEDCLYLNVRTSNLGGAEKQPVMVWIHGGGHQNGSASEAFYQSNSLVLRGIVLVTINYRLGPLGYFAHPDLSAESEHGVSGNYGTLDQIAALRWVRDNIAAFGGDPANVTIFGESAGGESVADMMASPPARGLFHRAIMQSASTGETMLYFRRSVLNRMAAEEAGEAFADRVVGGVDDQIEALRAMSPDEILAAFRKYPEFQTYSYPIVDGYVLPKSVVETFLDGDQAPIPLMVGSNADEGTLLYDLGTDPLDIEPSGPGTLTEYEEYVRRTFGEDADEIPRLYPAAADSEVEKAVEAIYCDGRFGSKARLYARQMTLVDRPAYLYFFTRVPPSPRQTVGAFHAVDIGFVFERMVPLFPTNDYDPALAKTMADYWARFATAGDPNKAGLPEWPAFSEAEQSNMVFGPKIGAAPVERAAKYDIMDRHLLRTIETVRAEK